MALLVISLAIALMSLAASSAHIFTSSEHTVASLSAPSRVLCRDRPHSFEYGGHKYYLPMNITDFDKEGKMLPKRMNWLIARNECRKMCMETISIQTEAEYAALVNFMSLHKVWASWTSGRLCDFEGCQERYEEPQRRNGWFWLGTNTRIPDTSAAPPTWENTPWSFTGYDGDHQPDNIEFGYTSVTENCLAVLNNHYDDGVKWHDVGCYHYIPFICEDSDVLLSYVRQSYGVTL